MKSIIISTVLAAVALCGLHFAAAANPPSVRKVTGIYSDMRAEPQTGDILGIEVFVVLSRSGYQVVFQDAEGSPNIPIVVSATVDNTRIEFALPQRAGYSGKFIGEITNYEIKGEFTSGQLSSFGKKSFTLKKGKSYWQ